MSLKGAVLTGGGKASDGRAPPARPTCSHLCSVAANYVTGLTLGVNGGRHPN